MNIWEKSLLLMRLRRRLESERSIDWQTLHKRDRSWALTQPRQSAWQLLQGWLGQWEGMPRGGINLSVFGASAMALVIGFVLMSGLLAFQPFQRINLLWFIAFAVVLPFAWWLLALFFTSAQVPFPLRTLVMHRLLPGEVPAGLTALLKPTLIALGQQLSLLFSLGMLIAFLLYLLMTDLAFGWSSTLDLGSGLVHRITSLLAWPWSTVWPAAVPTVELIEQTHYFRAAPLAVEQPALFGQWWRFLLMCLLVYVLLPRLVTTALARLRLSRMLVRVRDRDALISGLWQRLTTGLVDQEMESVEQREGDNPATEMESLTGHYGQIVCWGIWPEELINPLRAQLVGGGAGTRWIEVESSTAPESVQASLANLPDQPLLLLCKGWEPPTGELADLCQLLAQQRSRLFLWPVPLEGMAAARQSQLIQSWKSFMRQIPDRVHLVSENVPGRS
ncbi:DUF2868 domain-containing protein [Sedimenticola thiotaurini]|uniref:DUF2868 domain-containing protein n=1 Tax=Sedimenticola thiotaurini TaxID=1543721 RepID=UPI00069BD7B6|nr:DUF2868 domain-containing protein [Sedimenticola thiotaurini]